jgi:hypothetical protein
VPKDRTSNKDATNQEALLSPEEKGKLAGEENYPALFEFLESKAGNELAKLVVSVIGEVKKLVEQRTSDQVRLNARFQRSRDILEAVVFFVTIAAAAFLAWHGKLDATVAAFLGTAFGYFLRGYRNP